jgi:PPK2 family polyphosphate:nucleotide phosphotransferase
MTAAVWAKKSKKPDLRKISSRSKTCSTGCTPKTSAPSWWSFRPLTPGGKDGTIRKVFGPINPQGCQVTSFKVPTKLESSHDFLWRIHQAAPAAGKIAVFNRSHYESVLIESVHGWITPEEERKRLDHIRHFEALLTDRGTTILKFFLLISKEEQKRRFQERLDNPDKNWKFSSGDLQERRYFETYLGQFEKVLGATSSGDAPWFVVPANDKKFRNYLVSSIVRETLEGMNPQFPPPEEGLEDIVLD